MMNRARAMSHISSNTEAEVSKRIMFVDGSINLGSPGEDLLAFAFVFSISESFRWI